MKIGRNDPCHCGSGRKYKKCHEAQDEAARSAELAKQAEARAKELAASDAEKVDEPPPPPPKGGAQRLDADGAPRPKGKGFSTAKLPRRGAV